MEKSIRWLHLSDIHFNQRKNWKDSRARNSLISFLKERFDKEPDLRPDFVFCTGDIGYGSLPADPLSSQYSQAAEFFDQLVQICGRNGAPLDREKIFIVPGNHDVNRKSISSFAQETLNRWAEDDPEKYEDVINQIFSDETNRDIELAFERLSEYQAFVSGHFKHLDTAGGRLIYAGVHNVGGLGVGIAGLNSAWSCAGDEDDRHLWMAAEYQLNDAAQKLKNSDVSIGLVHHPLDWLNRAERSKAKKRIGADFDILLHGHSHDAWVESGGSYVAIGAGATAADKQDEFGVNIVKLDLGKNRGVAHLFTYSIAHGGWSKQVIPKHAPEGQWLFSLPGDQSLSDTDTSIQGTTYIRQETLESLLTPLDSIQDSWRRMITPVALVGRREFLDRLMRFLDTDAPIVWQVLHGSHAVGKSRLATEWLREVRETRPGWGIGILPENLDKIDDLPGLLCSRSLAIIVDNAGSYGANLWKFLRQLIAQNGNITCRLRILLIDHSDLNPPEFPFDSHELIIACREYSENLPPVDAHPTTQSIEYQGKNRRNPQPGLLLTPLSADEQAELLNIVAKSEDALQFFSSPQAAEAILRDTGGVPPFLQLAALEPKNWTSKVREYAQSIAGHACTLFAPSIDGLKVLLLSVLAGPAPASLREQIAPDATDPQKLALLFPQSLRSDALGAPLTDDVPKFEPDLLGQEVLFAAISRLPVRDRLELALSIGEAMPERFRDKVVKLWKETAGASDLISAVTDERRTRNHSDIIRGQILELLFEAAARTNRSGINEPIGGLCRIRAERIAHMLWHGDNMSAPTMQKVFESALKHAPTDSLACLFVEMNASMRCDATSHQLWASLIHYYLGEWLLPPIDGTDYLRIEGFDLSEEDIARDCLAKLTSTDPQQRMITSFRIAEWARDKSTPADKALIFKIFEPLRDEVLDALRTMLSSSLATDRVPAAWCFKILVRHTSILNAAHALRTKDVDALVTLVKRHPATSYAFIDSVAAIGLLCGRYFGVKKIVALLPLKATPSSHLAPAMELPLERWSEALISTYSRANGHAEVRFTLALALLRLGRCHPDMSKAIIDNIFNVRVTLTIRMQIAHLLSNHGEESSHDALLTIYEHGSDEEQLLVLALAGHHGLLRLLEDLRYARTTLPSTIDVGAFIDEALAHPSGGPWTGDASNRLRSELRDAYIRRHGHLVHKLKAKDTTGRWAYYFVLVDDDREKEFLLAIEGDGTIDLEDFGFVVTSCYGEEPNQLTKNFLKEHYGFDV